MTERSLLQKHLFSKVLLAFLWIASLAAAVASQLASFSRATSVAASTSLMFIAVFISFLARAHPLAHELPDLEFLLTPRISFWVAVGSVIGGLVISTMMGMVIGPAVSMMLVSALLGLGITIAWRRWLTRRSVILGVVAATIVALGIAFLGNGDLSWAIFNLVTIPPLFTAGVLLVNQTHLARIHFFDGDYTASLSSFLWACVLAIPACIINLLGNIQLSDTWVTYWWQSFYAIAPAIGEETWARLFLTTLCYAVLRPTTNQHPNRAIWLAILVGALAHGFAHTGINPIGLVIGSLLYGIPTALLFIKYDFEHAVGYHFMIDFVRFAAAVARG